MIIVESGEIKNMERAAVRQGVSLSHLMEQAGAAVAELAAKIITEKKLKKVTVLCGKGNNGGDGFVIARFLSLMCDVSVVVVDGYPVTDLAKLNYNLIPDKVKVHIYSEEPDECITDVMDGDNIIIDAIYGIGFRDSLSPACCEIINLANRNLSAVRIAVDVPSGAVCDTGEVPDECFRADHTVTFTALKPLHVLYPAADYCGEVSVKKVGIPKNIIDQCTYTMKTTDEFVQTHPLKVSGKAAHKGSNGTLLSVCGSYGMAGAAVLSGMAALRCGVGLLRQALPESIYPIAAAKLTEAVFLPLPESSDGLLSVNAFDKLQMEILERCTALLIGCGLGQNDDMPGLVSALLSTSERPVILDADGINAAALNIDILRQTNAPVILTPHPGEMARLTGTDIINVQKNRYQIAKNFAAEYGVTVVLKGANTIIALPDGNAYVNLTGNNGMAKGGSGDVLAGMIGAFLAQGNDPDTAAINAVYYHGILGDRCMEKYSARTMLPSDMIEEICYVL
ncbi:MAG: NAD(P)H-hydrate dehydratase [Clostridia bacterium]|nr:NAD(P)H-hydrate dehydratase [Clostridia bacterium]